MQFVLLPVHQPSDDPKGGVATDDPEGVVIRAHRVIVASRCEWFRRALQSGMKEAIDRLVEVVGELQIESVAPDVGGWLQIELCAGR